MCLHSVRTVMATLQQNLFLAHSRLLPSLSQLFFCLYLSHKVRYSLRHTTTPAPQMPDVWFSEAALSVSFNFLKNPASAGFLLSGHPAMWANDTNYQKCDAKHISLFMWLMNPLIYHIRSQSQNFPLKKNAFSVLLICC